MAELEGSLGRMGFDRIDVLYSSTLPDSVSVATCVEQIARVLDTGTVSAWAVVNWSAEHLAAAVTECERAGIPAPCAAQLPYSLGRTDGSRTRRWRRRSRRPVRRSSRRMRWPAAR